MKPLAYVSLATTLAVTGLALASTESRAQSRGEVEAARANARAGGPVSERDAYLLEQYGCLSGTQSPFCERLSHRGYRAGLKHKQRRARHWW